MGDRWRGFRVLMAFSFRAAPRETTIFLLSGALMSLTAPAAALGAKLLVDAALQGHFGRGLVASVLLSLTAGFGLIITLYYIDMLFSVAEKAGAAVDRRLIELMAGVPGLAHHERPDYLDQLDLLREQRGSLAWMTNSTAGIVRVAVQLMVTGVLLARLHPALLLLPLVGLVSFLAGRKAQDLQQRALESSAEQERLRHHLFDSSTTAPLGKELRVFGLAGEMIARHHRVAGATIGARNRAEWQAAGLQSIDALVSGLAYAAAIGLVLVRAVHGQATPGDVVLAVGLVAGGERHGVHRRDVWHRLPASAAGRSALPLVGGLCNGGARHSEAARLGPPSPGHRYRVAQLIVSLSRHPRRGPERRLVAAAGGNSRCVGG